MAGGDEGGAAVERAERPVAEAGRVTSRTRLGPPRRWTYAGYKGGSLNGALTLGWLLRRHDGRRFVRSLMLNNPKALVREEPALLRAF